MPSPKMMTVMCPNCQHRFPAPGCCNPVMQQQQQEESNRLMAPQSSQCKDFYGGGGVVRVPRGFTRGNGCFISAPTIINGPTIIQSGDQVGLTNPTIESFLDLAKNPSQSFALNGGEASNGETSSASSNLKLSRTGYHMITNGDHTGGGVTITTPRIQSGGCLVECIDSGVLFKSPAEIRPQLSAAGFSLQDQLSTEIPENSSPIMDEEELWNLPSPNLVENEYCWSTCNDPGVIYTPPSGCQELPGMRSNFSSSKNSQNRRFSTCSSNQFNCHRAGSSVENRQQTCCHNNQQSSCCCQNSNRHTSQVMHVVQGSNPDLQLSVNATLQLPSNLGQCTINFTASTNSLKNSSAANPSKTTSNRSWNNFNGGGIIQPDNNHGMNGSNLENRDTSPSTPVSWLMPSPWSFDNILMDMDTPRLCEVKKMLMTTGWYYPELNWKQSQELVKGASVGSWLIRDSSDKRFTFSVTVQISKGATSVRVHHYGGQFRFDAVEKFATIMPLFDCPIKMIEYYVMYSKMEEEKREVWLDCNSGMRRQIYLTKPLVKEVRSLSHLARLAVNTYQLPTYQLPHPIRNYLAEYPYSI